MRPYPMAIVVIALLLTSGIPAPDASGAQPCDSDEVNTLVVGGTQPEEYASIQAAIDDACEGDNVLIQAGVYHERIFVNKTIRLSGAGQRTAATKAT